MIMGRKSLRVDELTPRELDVMRRIATGEENAAIAKNLFVSEKTVQNHISHIRSKLDIHTRAQIVVYAYKHGIAKFEPIW
jgi:DNA-binding NarL/FixJ family response regulator